MGRMVIPVTDVSVDRYRQVLESHGILVEEAKTDRCFSLACSRLGSRRGFCFSVSEGIRDGKIHDIYRTELGADYPKVKGEMTCSIWFESAFVAPRVCNLLYEAGLLLLTRPYRVPPLPPPCPKCGQPLRAKLAKQCFACGADLRESAPQGGE